MSSYHLNASLQGKLVYCGRLKLISPLLIGTGEKEENIDTVVIKDEAGQPFVPATSLVGALRHYCDSALSEQEKKREEYEYFWGSTRDVQSSSKQSALYIRDLELLQEDIEKIALRVRDGVAIDNASGIAEREKKFEYEVVEPGISFQFYMEITLRQAFDDQEILKMANFIIQALQNSAIKIGAKTTRGFGRCCLKDVGFRKFNFAKKKDVIDWLNGKWEYNAWEPSAGEMVNPVKKHNLIINGIFSIKNSLIVRSYSGKPEAPDNEHLKSGGKPVLPGTTAAGALRARAEKIAHTFVPKDKCQEHIIRPLFGWADDHGDTKEKRKSRVIIEEKPIKHNITEEVQTRIRIDRFTGGTLKHHLFEEMPMWPKNSRNEYKEMVNLKIEVEQCKDYEVGLLLLVFKDLWNGDLPLGGGKNIGRGVLQGLNAEIYLDGRKISLQNASYEKKLSTGIKKEPVSIEAENGDDIDASLFMQEKVQAFLDKTEELAGGLENES